jgi:hypothetical protein
LSRDNYNTVSNLNQAGNDLSQPGPSELPYGFSPARSTGTYHSADARRARPCYAASLGFNKPLPPERLFLRLPVIGKVGLVSDGAPWRRSAASTASVPLEAVWTSDGGIPAGAVAERFCCSSSLRCRCLACAHRGNRVGRGSENDPHKPGVPTHLPSSRARGSGKHKDGFWCLDFPSQA